jgi:hypothetical protein
MRSSAKRAIWYIAYDSYWLTLTPHQFSILFLDCTVGLLLRLSGPGA